jgi:hypothetical protein
MNSRRGPISLTRCRRVNGVNDKSHDEALPAAVRLQGFRLGTGTMLYSPRDRIVEGHSKVLHPLPVVLQMSCCIFL